MAFAMANACLGRATPCYLRRISPRLKANMPQHDIEPIIKRVVRSADNLLRWNPQIELLNLAVLALEF